MTILEQQRDHFNQISEQYRVARSHSNHLRLKELIWQYFLQAHPELGRPDMAVLEAMCGYGEGYDILAKNFSAPEDYKGFDYSDNVVEYMAEHHPDRDIFHQDITTFSAPNEYDLVIVLGGLHHVPDYCDQALENLYASLKPGGYMINLEPTHGFFLTRWSRERIYEQNALFDQESERAFEVEDYHALFESHGFDLVDAIYPGLLSYVLYYNPDAFPFLNKGPTQLVEAIFAMEAPFMRTNLAKTLSFATLALWQKPHE